MASPGMSNYFAAKAGVVALTMDDWLGYGKEAKASKYWAK